MKPLEISKIEVFITGDEKQERPRWAKYLEEIFTTNTIVRITTKDGYIGIGGTITYTENHFDKSIGETIRLYVPNLIGKSALNTEKIWSWMSKRPTVIAKPAMSVIDIALWDLRAKYAGMPLYQMLGGARDKILSYASTPLLDSNQEYMEFIDRCIAEGFRAIKIHPYAVFKDDYPLVKEIQKKYRDSGIRFSFDPDQQYSREEAYKMAKLLEEYDWDWFEAPLPDTDLEGYVNLKKKTNIPISCGGNHYLSLAEIQHGIKLGAWTDIRVDTTVCGGITPMRKLVALAEANNMRIEIQSWGMTLTQAANLHIMLSTNACTYFEQAYPYKPFEVGALDVIRTDENGYVHAPEGNGLGVRMDWDAIENITIEKFEYK
ncbi:mandelate racemase/muconate lactonizing enzyme family protein [Clostridium ganghwense]|uniref:Mandelate racemase/muconate lactonizing enzyme family protein n=1 Tax=Clostridium ganghwense TaxID=312089 RepID=A0ABT4CUJ5_9CLOT|nr:mandelate racemase/muconate lactonizing enzyme family protein [Clostridium ganghwense]MCY6371624.1 mandelate racemase/muconate lactonizing enzyme family protein [Clostridium ganghwense]